MVQKGYAEKSFQQVQQGKTWFIPHHGIYHPSKPGKIQLYLIAVLSIMECP